MVHVVQNDTVWFFTNHKKPFSFLLCVADWGAMRTTETTRGDTLGEMEVSETRVIATNSPKQRNRSTDNYHEGITMTIYLVFLYRVGSVESQADDFAHSHPSLQAACFLLCRILQEFQ